MQNPKHNRPLAGLMAFTGYGLVYFSQTASSSNSPQSVLSAGSMLALMLLSACGLFYLTRVEFRPAPVRK